MDKYSSSENDGRSNDQVADRAGNAPGNIVSFEDYRRADNIETLLDVERYWHQLRGSFLLLQSRDLRADDLNPYLPNIFIADKIAPGLVQIRTAGTGITASLGMDPRGMPLSALFRTQARATLATAVHGILDTPEVTRLTLQAARPFMPTITAKMLLLPLLDDLPEPSRIFGVLASNCDAADDRPRFEITQTQSYPLDLAAATPPDQKRVIANMARTKILWGHAVTFNVGQCKTVTATSSTCGHRLPGRKTVCSAENTARILIL